MIKLNIFLLLGFSILSNSCQPNTPSKPSTQTKAKVSSSSKATLNQKADTDPEEKEGPASSNTSDSKKTTQDKATLEETDDRSSQAEPNNTLDEKPEPELKKADDLEKPNPVNQPETQNNPVSPPPKSPTPPKLGNQPIDSSNPLKGLKFFVDPVSQPLTAASKLAKTTDAYKASFFIGSQAAGKWIGRWTDPVNPKKQVAEIVDKACSLGQVPILIIYNIPNLDCGQYSASSTVLSPAAYSAWIQGVADGTGGKKVVIVVEPDGLGLIDECTHRMADYNANDQIKNVQTAINNLASNPNAILYLDMGYWMDEKLVATYLPKVDPQKKLRGIALNTSNYQATPQMVAKCEKVRNAVKDRKITCVIDTSRNGKGALPASSKAGEEDWCNPPGRAIGNVSTAETGNSNVDGYLWLKVPGESDGACRGGPAAGAYWQERATEFYNNSNYKGK